MIRKREKGMLRLVAGLLLVAAAASAGEDTPAPVIPDSPEAVRPIEVGATMPEVTLATPDYQPVMLREVLAKQVTVLIYYRGGW